MRAQIAVVATVVAGLSSCGGHLTLGSLPSPGAAPTVAHATVHAGTGHRTGSGLFAIHDPGEVTGTLTGPCRARDHGELPDRSCTPGAIDPAVTQADIGSTICRSGVHGLGPPARVADREVQVGRCRTCLRPARRVRRAGSRDPAGTRRANDARNLWVEAGPIPNHKDAVEDALNQAVCDGRMKLRAAQVAIARNWIKAGAALGVHVPR